MSAGFTLIELVIVVAILAVISIFALQTFGPQQAKARDARRFTQIRTMATTLERYMNDFNQYPVVTASSGPARFIEVRDLLASAISSRVGLFKDPGSLQYTYDNTATGYCICAELETNSPEANSGAGCVSGQKTHFCLKNTQ